MTVTISNTSAGESPRSRGARRFLRNPAAVAGLVFLAALAAVALFAPYFAPQHYATDDLFSDYRPPALYGLFSGGEQEAAQDGRDSAQDTSARQPPGASQDGSAYWLGADFMGRDLLSRLIYGARVSLAVALVGAGISFALGLLYGITAGYLGGRIDNAMMRVVDVLYAMPTLVVVILIMVYFRAGQPEHFTGIKATLYRWDSALGGMLFIFVGIGITSWLQMARIARGETLSLKGRDFVTGAEALGIGHWGMITRHLLPNLLGPCIVLETASIPGYILTETFLSFIGLGVNPPMPSWGSMINEGYQAMRSYPHVILWPVLTLTATVLAFNFAGDGLRDALDPRLAE